MPVHAAPTLLAALFMVGGAPSLDPSRSAQRGHAQGPTVDDASAAQAALARLRGLWVDAHGLSLRLESQGGQEGRLIADDEGRLFVDWTEPIYEAREPGGVLRVVGSKQYVVASDGAQVTEFDGHTRRMFTRASQGPPQARSSHLAYIDLPFPGRGGYFAELLRQVDGARARLEASGSGRSLLVLPLATGSRPSRVLEYHIHFDPEFTRIQVIRVVGQSERGPVGIRWTMSDIAAHSERPEAAQLQFERPEDALEVAEEAFCMPLVGDVVPEFSVATLAGGEFSLDAALASNQAVLVQFWGSWCGPCVRELPHIEALAKVYRRRGLAVLGLACDDSVHSARAAVERAGVTFPIAVDAVGGAGLGVSLGVRAFPTLMLIGAERRVLWHSHARLGGVEDALGRALPE